MSERVRVCPESEGCRRMVLPWGRGILVLTLRELLYAEADKGRTRLHLASGERDVDMSLADLQREISSSMFFRTHHSYLVNLGQAVAVKLRGDRSYEVLFADSQKSAWVSRARAPALFAALRLLCG